MAYRAPTSTHNPWLPPSKPISPSPVRVLKAQVAHVKAGAAANPALVRQVNQKVRRLQGVGTKYSPASFPLPYGQGQPFIPKLSSLYRSGVNFPLPYGQSTPWAQYLSGLRRGLGQTTYAAQETVSLAAQAQASGIAQAALAQATQLSQSGQLQPWAPNPPRSNGWTIANAANVQIRQLLGATTEANNIAGPMITAIANLPGNKNATGVVPSAPVIQIPAANPSAAAGTISAALTSAQAASSPVVATVSATGGLFGLSTTELVVGGIGLAVVGYMLFGGSSSRRR